MLEMKYVYEQYETNWWNRYTAKEWRREKAIREKKGLGFFKTFSTDKDLGEVVHLKRGSGKY